MSGEAKAMLDALTTKVELFAKDLEARNDDNVSRALNERMCCNGLECGCQGSTIGEYLAYQLRECIK